MGWPSSSLCVLTMQCISFLPLNVEIWVLCNARVSIFNRCNEYIMTRFNKVYAQSFRYVSTHWTLIFISIRHVLDDTNRRLQNFALVYGDFFSLFILWYGGDEMTRLMSHWVLKQSNSSLYFIPTEDKQTTNTCNERMWFLMGRICTVSGQIRILLLFLGALGCVCSFLERKVLRVF